MPTITINGKSCDFNPGQTILQVANDHAIEIPQYCYHDGLSIVASCRICLAEVWAPNPRNNNALEPYMGGKLLPTCQTTASDGMAVYTDSPKSVQNQKAVMEYLLINHPLDCPVCDQSGECFLQDYSYQYGRGVSRFEEAKVKQPKKNLGPHVYLYADRCIMCSRCVRFTREVSGTAELIVQGRGNKSEIDVFPGLALDNELSANVIDLCPVGALLDKDFLFTQRVWFLKSTPSIDGLTSSGDNILVEHNAGKVYRLKPRTNMQVNKWWITDEVRYGWKFVHDDSRLNTPRRTQFGVQVDSDWNRAIAEAVAGMKNAVENGKRLALLVSTMLPSEEAWALARFARQLDPQAILAVGPVPVSGQDKAFPKGIDPTDPNAFIMRAEKCPNARGVRRALAAVAGQGNVLEYNDFLKALGQGSGNSNIAAALITGGYPSDWTSPDLMNALQSKFVVAVELLDNPLVQRADIVLPGAAWVEKAGSFENATGLIQAFEQAIPTPGLAKTEGQIALDLSAELEGAPTTTDRATIVKVIEAQPGQVPQSATIATPRAAALFNAANTRINMANTNQDLLGVMATQVHMPTIEAQQEADMQVVEL